MRALFIGFGESLFQPLWFISPIPFSLKPSRLSVIGWTGSLLILIGAEEMLSGFKELGIEDWGAAPCARWVALLGRGLQGYRWIGA